MTDKLKKIIELYKYPLVILIIGLTLMLIPGSKKAEKIDNTDEAMLLQNTLAAIAGVGETKTIISESGVVVVCEGADKAAVKLDIINAVKSYTGFSADKICVLKISK